LPCQPENLRVFAEPGKIFFALTLLLNPQQIHHVGLGKDIVDLMRDGDAEIFKFARHEGDWPDQRDARAQFDEAKNVRPGDTAEQNISENRYVQTGNFSTLLANRVKIEKRLRGVLVRAIAGVDHARLQSLPEELRRARRTVSQDENISVQRFKVARSIFERFALRQAR